MTNQMMCLATNVMPVSHALKLVRLSWFAHMHPREPGNCHFSKRRDGTSYNSQHHVIKLMEVEEVGAVLKDNVGSGGDDKAEHFCW